VQLILFNKADTMGYHNVNLNKAPKGLQEQLLSLSVNARRWEYACLIILFSAKEPAKDVSV